MRYSSVDWVHRHVVLADHLYYHCCFLPQPSITLKVINGIYCGVKTVELDNLAAETAATMTTKHPDYAVLAARIAVSNLHKETKKLFSGEFVIHSLPCKFYENFKNITIVTHMFGSMV